MQIQLMLACVAISIAGMLLTLMDIDWGVRLLGVSMITSALWQGRFDVARRTVRQSGLSYDALLHTFASIN